MEGERECTFIDCLTIGVLEESAHSIPKVWKQRPRQSKEISQVTNLCKDQNNVPLIPKLYWVSEPTESLLNAQILELEG